MGPGDIKNFCGQPCISLLSRQIPPSLSSTVLCCFRCQHGWFLKVYMEEMKTWTNLLFPTLDTLKEGFTGTAIFGNEVFLLLVQDMIHWYTSSEGQSLNHFLVVKSTGETGLTSSFSVFFPSPLTIQMLEDSFEIKGNDPTFKLLLFCFHISFPSHLDILNLLGSFWWHWYHGQSIHH